MLTFDAEYRIDRETDHKATRTASIDNEIARIIGHVMWITCG
jgi:hypothetical protein